MLSDLGIRKSFSKHNSLPSNNSIVINVDPNKNESEFARMLTTFMDDVAKTEKINTNINTTYTPKATNYTSNVYKTFQTFKSFKNYQKQPTSATPIQTQAPTKTLPTSQSAILNTQIQKNQKQNIINNLQLSINALQNKINHIHNELTTNEHEYFEIDKDSIKVLFDQERIQHEKFHYSKDIPEIKREINELKQKLNKIVEQNRVIHLQGYKIETESTLQIEDIKKFNLLSDAQSKQNAKIAYELISLRNKIINLKINIQKQSKSNDILKGNIDDLIKILN